MSSLIPRPHRPSGQRLEIDERALARIHAHAVEGYPHEVVGLLAGERSAGRVRRVVPLENENQADPARRFAVDGLRLMRAEQAVEADGDEVLGYYHSHPDHPAAWSDADRDQALPATAYVITAVHGPDGPEGDGERTRVIDTRAYRLADDRGALLDDLLVLLPSP